ncbi:hypothetical protein BGW80DRAFT_1567137 [Lactifluus volemus]|nr:hypothetical protein BGW80DRAFT_1567137 [Lactifluus volemus]
MTPRILCLPTELLDLIASFVVAHRDLIALAMACRAFAFIVIPAHAAYRTIRIHGQRGPTPWANIAAHPHRAIGVRSVVLFDHSEEARFLPERAPNITALPDRSGRRHEQGVRGGLKSGTLLAAASALRVMPNLHSLILSGSFSRDTTACHAAETAFWVAASSHGSLKRLEYTQTLSPPAPLPWYMTDLHLHPLWSISNLTSLTVKNALFLRHPPSVTQFSRVLRNSPALESLTVETHDQSFDLHMLLGETRFPLLSGLSLSIHARPEPTNSRTFSALLERTPTLQHVAWRYLEPNPLSPNALPALRSLRIDVPDSPGAAGCGLLRTAEHLAALGPVYVTPETLEAMVQMRRRDTLRVLDVARFDGIASLVRVVRLFARLRWLRVPAVDYWHEHAPVTPAPVHRAEWFGVLNSLPMLEVFRGVSFFHDPERASIEENDERACHILNKILKKKPDSEQES